MTNALEIDVKLEELTQARRFEIIRISAWVTLVLSIMWAAMGFFLQQLSFFYSRGNHDTCIAHCRCFFEHALSSLGAFALGGVYLGCGHDWDFTRE